MSQGQDKAKLSNNQKSGQEEQDDEEEEEKEGEVPRVNASAVYELQLSIVARRTIDSNVSSNYR